MKQYTYLLILALSLAGPLLLSFDKKVHFYTKWKFAIPAMILPAVIYIAWDSLFTKWGVWNFNEQKIIGVKLFNLPLEEISFFFIVPYCCTFIYECVRTYFPNIKKNKSSTFIFGAAGLIFFSTGLLFYNRMYSASTFLFLSFFIAGLFFAPRFFKNFNTAAFLLSYGIILIPFLIVNGLLTAIPVVIYNNSENLGLRIYTIPLEDIFYGMLLVMMNIAIYERLKNRNVLK